MFCEIAVLPVLADWLWHPIGVVSFAKPKCGSLFVFCEIAVPLVLIIWSCMNECSSSTCAHMSAHLSHPHKCCKVRLAESPQHSPLAESPQHSPQHLNRTQNAGHCKSSINALALAAEAAHCTALPRSRSEGSHLKPTHRPDCYSRK